MFQQVQVTSLEEFVIQVLNTLFQTNNVLAFLLIIACIWGGRWFGRVAWADIVSYFKSKEETAERHFQVELAAETERAKRNQENDKLTMEAVLNLSGEMRAAVAVLETQRVLLIHILRSMNGSGKAIEKAMDEATDAAKAARGPG